MAQKKSFQELDLNNAFMFAAAMEDGEICRLVLEIILGESIGPVRVKTERNILFCSDFRCIRLDVYAKDTLNIGYNLEMQNRDEKNLPKRSRYHQAENDTATHLSKDVWRRIFLNTKGENDEEVPESLIHFLHYVSDSTDSYVNQMDDSAIDKLHEKVKRLSKTVFPTDDSLLKMLYLAMMDITKKCTGHRQD